MLLYLTLPKINQAQAKKIDRYAYLRMHFNRFPGSHHVLIFINPFQYQQASGVKMRQTSAKDLQDFRLGIDALNKHKIERRQREC